MSAQARAAAAVPVDVILRDGSTLRLRAPGGGDAGALIAFFERLSEHSRYLRFHGVRHVDASLVEHFARSGLDRPRRAHRRARRRDGRRAHRRARGVRAPPRPGSRPRSRSPSPTSSRARARHAAARAARSARGDAGIERFVAEVLPENAAMLAVFRDAGFEVVAHARGRRGRGAVPDRADRALPRARRRARPRRRRRVAPSVLRARFGRRDRRLEAPRLDRRRALPQHPRGGLRRRRVSGQPRRARRSRACAAYRSIAEIPDPVDLAVICLPGAHVLEAAEEALRHGVRALCVISAGFAEIGVGGRRAPGAAARARARARRAARRARTASASRSPALGLNATFAPRALPAGRIGFSSQSGALGLALLEKAPERGLGFSAFVSIGNKADVSSNDLLEWWEDDDGTDLVLLYLESFGNPQQVRARRRGAGAAQADPRAEGGNVARRRARRELAHGRARRLGRRRRRALPQAGVLRARQRSRSSSTSRRCSRASRSRRPPRRAC